MKPSDHANLVYVNDTGPGIVRLRRGKGFVYRDAAGRWLRDADELRRIRQLAIPPAYTDVWICPLPNGHLQATGRDARGRKQYRYHADWRQRRDEDKYDRLAAFGRALPRIRARVARDLAQRDGRQLSQTLVLATMVRLLDTTCIRVGSDRYARSNGSFGLTTLRNRHARVDSGTLRLSFQGKGGIRQLVTLDDPRIAHLVRRLQELPGQELFQYQDSDGELRTVGSADVNDYLSEAAGERFTAKDFRTWHGTVVALEWTRCAFDSEAAAAGATNGPSGPSGPSGDPQDRIGGYSVPRMLAEVARRLGNTPAICRKAYIHPDVLGLGATLCSDDSACTRLWSALADLPATPRGLQPAERRLLKFLGGRQATRRRSA